MPLRRYGRFAVETSHEDKPLFPEAGITKGGLIDHYESVWEVMRSHLRDRPLVLQRFPDGIAKEGFYQKQAGDWFPSFVSTCRVGVKQGGHQDLVIADKKATLAFLADQACVTLHAWLSRKDRLGHPDRLVVDLDPPPEGEFQAVRDAARWCGELLGQLGLSVYLATTGSRGLHVVVPLDRGAPFDAVRAFAREAMELLAARHPERLTLAQRKARRGPRIYLDLARNAYGQTVVAPYAVRALAEAPVATPITWDELARTGPRSWTVRNLRRRLAAREDPWSGIGRRAAGLGAAKERLARMRG